MTTPATRLHVGLAMLVVALGAAGSARAFAKDVAPKAKATPLEQARAQTASTNHHNAWPLYKQALAVNPTDVDLIAEVARAAANHLLLERAETLVTEGETLLDAIEDPTSKDKRLARTLRAVTAEVRRIRTAQMKFVPQHVDRAIRYLYKHSKNISKQHLVPRVVRRDGVRYQLTKKYRGPHLWANVLAGTYPKNALSCFYHERYRDKEVARARYEHLVKLCWTLRKTWERKHEDRTAKRRPTLMRRTAAEDLAAKNKQPRPGSDGITFCWEADTNMEAFVQSVAEIALVPPRGVDTDEPGVEGIWTVYSMLDSRWFVK